MNNFWKRIRCLHRAAETLCRQYSLIFSAWSKWIWYLIPSVLCCALFPSLQSLRIVRICIRCMKIWEAVLSSPWLWPVTKCHYLPACWQVAGSVQVSETQAFLECQHLCHLTCIGTCHTFNLVASFLKICYLASLSLIRAHQSRSLVSVA